MVRGWAMRLSMIVLSAFVAGAPSLSALCDTWCADASAPSAQHQSHQHPASAGDPVEPAGETTTASPHAHHDQAAAVPAVLSTHAFLSAVPTSNCDQPLQVGEPLSARRADTTVRTPLRAVATPALTLAIELARHGRDNARHRPPDRILSSSLAPLVLRI